MMNENDEVCPSLCDDDSRCEVSVAGGCDDVEANDDANVMPSSLYVVGGCDDVDAKDDISEIDDAEKKMMDNSQLAGGDWPTPCPLELYSPGELGL